MGGICVAYSVNMVFSDGCGRCDEYGVNEYGSRGKKRTLANSGYSRLSIVNTMKQNVKG